MKLITDTSNIVKDYFVFVQDKINNNVSLNSIFFFDYDIKKDGDRCTYDVNFRSVFGNKFFLNLSLYIIMIGGFIVYLTKSMALTIILTIIIAIFLLPVFFQSKYFIQFIIKRMLRKKGYVGVIKCQ